MEDLIEYDPATGLFRWKVFNFRGELQAEFDTEQEAQAWIDEHSGEMDSTYYKDYC